MEKVNQATDSSRYSAKQKLAKWLVEKALSCLQKGSLTVIDQHQTMHFGQRGAKPSAVIHVDDARMYSGFAFGGSVGAAEGFIDGFWRCDDLTAMIEIFVINQDVLDAFEAKFAFATGIANRIKHFANRNTEQGSKRNIVAHYDLGNTLYESFLSDEMLYSCAVYPHANASLEEAQAHKLAKICERVELKEGDSVIEIGTGWGAFAIYAATHYKVHVTTTTISDNQYDYVAKKIEQLGLQDSITLLKQDYRKLEGQYDKLVSIEMIEAVGHAYMDTFFKTCNKLLKDNGMMLIQAITINDQRFDKYLKDSDFIQQYIFPGGSLVSIEQMTKQLKQNTDLVMHQLSDIGLHYARTLADWRERFVKSWPQIEGAKFNQNFYRLWLYYFAYCEGAFRQRAISTVHLSARKQGYVSNDAALALNY